LEAITWDRPQRSESGQARRFTAGSAGHSIELMIVERPCRDTMAGSYYSYSASALIDGEQVEGCARAR
jgi:uncharacterized membrane protein